MKVPVRLWAVTAVPCSTEFRNIKKKSCLKKKKRNKEVWWSREKLTCKLSRMMRSDWTCLLTALEKRSYVAASYSLISISFNLRQRDGETHRGRGETHDLIWYVLGKPPVVFKYTVCWIWVLYTLPPLPILKHNHCKSWECCCKALTSPWHAFPKRTPFRFNFKNRQV